MDFRTKEKHLNGSYRIEYVLCNEFAVYLNSLKEIDIVAGFSNLRAAENIKLNEMELYYEQGSSSRKVAHLFFKTQDGLIQRLIIKIKEDDIKKAVAITDKIVSSILDMICLLKQTPLKVRQIEIYQSETKELLLRYVTFPYTSIVDLEGKDILMAVNIPRELTPCLRLFREAINSTSPHYRLLCLYRVREGLKKIQSLNAKKLKDQGIKFEKKSLKIPENDLTKQYFPGLIGKNYNEFFEHVYKEYRNSIAHLSCDNYENMMLDPASVRTDHRIDYTNALLIMTIRHMIELEWRFMKEYGLS